MADLSRKKATNLAQLRTSAHNLAIETGRYARPAVPSSERKCKMCDLDEVEDEVHFVNRCTAYEEDRRELFGNVGEVSMLTHIYPHKPPRKIEVTIMQSLG